MKRIIPILIFILLSGCTFSQRGIHTKNEIRGTVSKVIDGDTLCVLTVTNIIKVRLADIDAPEKKQEYGKESQMFMEKLAINKEVIVHHTGIDRYGRTIGIVIIATNMVTINQEALMNGWAYWYHQYSTNKELGILEGQARSNRLGLWASTNNIPPWEWRKMYK